MIHIFQHPINSKLCFLTGKTYGLKNLSTVHRLDRLTSGCQIFAKNLKTSQQCFEALKNRKVSKMYVTGLHGDFSSEEIRCDAPIAPICSRIGKKVREICCFCCS